MCSPLIHHEGATRTLEHPTSNTGIESIVRCMRLHADSEGVQCNACLAIMALVRGEGDVCIQNQWRVAKAGGVEAMAAAMAAFPSQPMVQLSTLLCIIPLCLGALCWHDVSGRMHNTHRGSENAVLQAHMTNVLMPHVLAALRAHPTEPDIQAKGLVALGVMAQGEEVVHDAIRRRQAAAGLPVLLSHVLRKHARDNDEALWACLFCLAVLIKDGSGSLRSQVLRGLAAAGVAEALTAAMEAFKEAAEEDSQAQEMIGAAGDFLVMALQPVVVRLRWERCMWGAVVLVPLAGAAAWCALRLRHV